MSQISPTYKNDKPGGVPPKLKEYLDVNYFANLQNIELSNPKLLVVFSGGNAVGKSTLSKKISKKFGGIVLENDEIKDCIVKFNPNYTRDERNKLTWQYSTDLYARLSDLTNNGLIIRDGVIDWYYDRILPMFKAEGYEIFIIGLDLSDKKPIELIKSRGDKPTVSADRLIELIPEHDYHKEIFRKSYTPDVILNDDNFNDDNIVLSKLGNVFANLTNK